MLHTGKDLITSKKVSTLLAQRGGYRLFAPAYFKEANIITIRGEMVHYGKVDPSGSPVEPIYEYSLEYLEGTGETLTVLDFVADQFAVMKRFYEQSSVKSGKIPRLIPQRATMRGDFMYNGHLVGFIDAFVAVLFSDHGARKVLTFHDFCKRFLIFIDHTRAAGSHRGTAVSKSLYYLNASAPINVSGLVIDFETSDYNDDAKKQMDWLEDPNFDLYCSAAKYAGFFVDLQHPYRIIANLADSKMQRAAEYTGGSEYAPGGASNIFSKYHFKTCLFEPMLIKDALFVAWMDIVNSRPSFKDPKFCKKGKLRSMQVNRERLSLEDRLVPPIPGAPNLSIDEALGAKHPLLRYKNAYDLNDSSIKYGLHSSKYDLIYWLKFYVEVRYREIAFIKDFLTQKEKNGIIKKAIGYVRRGHIDRAFEYIGSQFDSYIILGQ